MRRRTLLRTTSVALGTVLAGCLDGAALADGSTATEQPPDSGTETATTTDGQSEEEVTVSLTIENRANRSHAGTVEIAHIMTAACRYASPECQSPTEQNTVLDTSFDLAAGEQQSFQPITMGIGTDGDTVDSYSTRIQPDAITEGTSGGGILKGLEAGASSIVGRNEAGDHPWRVVARHYQIQAVIKSDKVEIAVQSVE